MKARIAWLTCILLGVISFLMGAPELSASYLAASLVIFGLSPEKPR